MEPHQLELSIVLGNCVPEFSEHSSHLLKSDRMRFCMFVKHENVVAHHNAMPEHKEHVMPSRKFPGTELKKGSQTVERIRLSLMTVLRVSSVAVTFDGLTPIGFVIFSNR